MDAEVEDPVLEPNESIVLSNDMVIADLKLLQSLRLIRLEAGRLVIMPSGREALAMPPALFISRLPPMSRAELARADIKLRGREYEACANICGRTLESFLKLAMRQLHPDAAARREDLKSMYGKEFELDQAALGTLVSMVTGVLGVNLKGEHVNSWNRIRSSRGLDARLMHFPSDSREQFAHLLSLCVPLRNHWSHDKTGPALTLSQQVESAHRLLQLTQMAISSYVIATERSALAHESVEALAG